MTRRAAALGVLADLAFGEAALRPHPVALFGSAMQRVESALWRDSRAPGVVHAAIGAGIGLAAGALTGSTAIAAYVATAPKGLHDAARAIHAELDRGDLEGARAALPSLVGRDPSQLDEKGIARAVVESVAENTVDGVIAPLCFAAVGGAPGAFLYRAINTMDSMVGHRGERYGRYGWAAAKIDDVANFVPARVTALLVAAVRPAQAGAVVDAVLHQAGAHPSPNAGVVEAAFAAALGIRLGGPLDYASGHEVRPTLGIGPVATPDDIPRAIALSRDVTLAAASVLLVSL